MGPFVGRRCLASGLKALLVVRSRKLHARTRPTQLCVPSGTHRTGRSVGVRTNSPRPRVLESSRGGFLILAGERSALLFVFSLALPATDTMQVPLKSRTVCLRIESWTRQRTPCNFR